MKLCSELPTWCELFLSLRRLQGLIVCLELVDDDAAKVLQQVCLEVESLLQKLDIEVPSCQPSAHPPNPSYKYRCGALASELLQGSKLVMAFSHYDS